MKPTLLRNLILEVYFICACGVSCLDFGGGDCRICAFVVRLVLLPCFVSSDVIRDSSRTYHSVDYL